MFLGDVLTSIKDELERKYSKYDKKYLICNTWNYLFDSDLLQFEKVCRFEEEDRFYFNVEYLKENFCNLASSEKWLLSLLIQQFSGYILDILTNFHELPMFASMMEKDKIYFIVELFDNYPLLLQN